MASYLTSKAATELTCTTRMRRATVAASSLISLSRLALVCRMRAIIICNNLPHDEHITVNVRPSLVVTSTCKPFRAEVVLCIEEHDRIFRIIQCTRHRKCHDYLTLAYSSSACKLDTTQPCQLITLIIFSSNIVPQTRLDSADRHLEPGRYPEVLCVRTSGDWHFPRTNRTPDIQST